MQTALHLKTTILPGGKIELVDPQLPSGEAVDIFVLLPESKTTKRRRLLMSLLKRPDIVSFGLLKR
jgi:hypothetical protein